jgi:hypothetical protein
MYLLNLRKHRLLVLSQSQTVAISVRWDNLRQFFPKATRILNRIEFH